MCFNWFNIGTRWDTLLCPSRRAVGIRPPSVAPSLWCKDSTFILIYATLLTRNFEGLLKKVLKTPLQRSVGHILRMKIFAFIFRETALPRGINRWGKVSRPDFVTFLLPAPHLHRLPFVLPSSCPANYNKVGQIATPNVRYCSILPL